MKNNITNYLTSLKRDELKLLLVFFANRITGNPDFKITLSENQEEELEEWFEDSPCELQSDVNRILDESAKAAIRKLLPYSAFEEPHLKKQEIIDLLAEVLMNETLAELLFLIMGQEDFINDMLLPATVQRLENDSVFQERLQYIERIRNYYEAAVNLYGVVDLGEFTFLVSNYEKEYAKAKRQSEIIAYERSTCEYPVTLLFNPYYVSTTGIATLLDYALLGVCISQDGLILHESFAEEFHKEEQELSVALGELPDGQSLESCLDSFFENHMHAVYRALYMRTLEKPMYEPSREEFLKYAEEDYKEKNAAVKNLKLYLKRRYRKEIAAAAEEEKRTPDDLLDEVLLCIRIIGDGNCADACMERDTDSIQMIFNELADIGITMEDSQGLDKRKELLSYIVALRNAERSWYNHGYSANEMRRMMPSEPGRMPTITAGSSQAAKMLAEAAGEIQGMGFNMDLDSNAVNVPAFGFSAGLNNAKMQQAVHKVYPNDPCPCGSGKKFKKCCGKN